MGFGWMEGLTGAGIGANLGVGLLNYREMRKQNKWMRHAQEYTWAREDIAMQRRVADLKAAGLSPVLAAGQGASTSSPISLTPPRLEIGDNATMALGLMKMKADIDRTEAEKEAIKVQIDKTINHDIPLTDAQKEATLANKRFTDTNTNKQKWDNDLNQNTGTVSNPSFWGGIVRDINTILQINAQRMLDDVYKAKSPPKKDSAKPKPVKTPKKSGMTVPEYLKQVR